MVVSVFGRTEGKTGDGFLASGSCVLSRCGGRDGGITPSLTRKLVCR